MAEEMDTEVEVEMAPITAKVAVAPQNLPWVEKYRPSTLDDLVSHKDIISTLERFIKEDRLPHLLFYGPPGTGKTSTIKACANLLYGSKQKSMVLELNASDDRGIDVVREQIKTFAGTRTVFNSGFKLVILDEADAMTNVAQAALRRVIEKYTKNTRFCLICNYVSGIIPALQSRCTRFRFAPLSKGQMKVQIQKVIESEKLAATDDGLDALIELSKGDMRKSLNILQCTAMACDVVNSTNVYVTTGHPLQSDIESILQWLLNDSFKDAYNNIMELKTLKGLALQDILSDIHTYINKIDFPVRARILLLERLADLEESLTHGATEKIQVGALVAAFQRVKALSAAEVS